MPEDNTAPATPVAPSPTPKTASPEGNGGSDVIASIIEKIKESHNILIALSGDPSVDEMASAIGLSLFLDRLGKRATAIYSGSTPNALEFLKPEDTFESAVDSLQDFVIALNKEKADHLRYKIDGDYVKVYITPYKTRISEEDLSYSYGDFNVDLVFALDVANGIDLDAALREHGRIMHDATIINITTGKPGKLGEIEWSDKESSSVSEMIAKLLYNINTLEKEEATAFLTGIVAATNRFSNSRTTPEAMKISSRLMESGANQQLISKNITSDLENELFGASSTSKSNNEPKSSDENSPEESSDDKAAAEDLPEKDSDAAPESEHAKPEPKISDEPENFDIKHGAEPEASKSEPTAEDSAKSEPTKDTTSEADAPDLLDDLKAAQESLASAGTETTPESGPEKFRIGDEGSTESSQSSTASDNPSADFISDKPEKVIQPSADVAAELAGGEGKYGQMLEDALASISTASPAPAANPAAASAPSVPSSPEINGVPSINYMPLPGDEVLPPPPAPPIDMSTAAQGAMPAPGIMPSAPVTPIEPATPAPAPEPSSLGSQPAMQDQIYSPQAADPSAFKIPGM